MILKNLREKNNLTQKELSKKANINLRTLQDYEQNHKNIKNARAITVYQLAKTLNCKMEDILREE